MKKDYLQSLIVICIFILLVLLLFNLFNIFSLKPKIEKRLIEIKNLSKPAELELIRIETNCVDCFNIGDVIQKLQNSDRIKIIKNSSIDFSESEAKELIEKYGIEKLPTIVLKGEINKTSLQGFKEKAGALIFTEIEPPYIDAKTMETIGKVNAIIVSDENCKVCPDLTIAIRQLQQNKVIFADVKYLDYKSNEAKEFINNFDIKRVPALFLSNDIQVYSLWQQLKDAFAFKENYYFIESPAPYVETETGRIKGLVDLIMITDKACQSCYNVSVNKQILARFGVVINSENTYDANSDKAKELISKYKIEKVPTILLSPEANVYDALVTVWPQVGSLEEDGWFVMRKPEVVGIVKDLTTNELIDLSSQNATNSAKEK